MNINNILFSTQPKKKISNQTPSEIFDHNQKQKVTITQMWNLIHTTSIYIPDSMSVTELQSYKSFLDSIFYFSKKTNQEFKKKIEKSIDECHINYSSRDDIVLSLCHLHNRVNLYSGKDQFPCIMNEIEERWGKR